MATFGPPSTSSSAEKSRPMSGETSRTWKKSLDTRSPRARSACPFATTLKPTLVETAMDEKTRLCSARKRYWR